MSRAAQRHKTAQRWRQLLAFAAAACMALPAGSALADDVVLDPPPPASPMRMVGEAAPRADKQVNVHGLGVAGSFATGTGLTYRRYWDNTVLQVAALGIATDRGENTLAFVGASVGQYLFVWGGRGVSAGVLPSTTALRVVGGGQWYERRSKDTVLLPSGQTRDERTRQRDLSAGVGIGFEFGGLVRTGFSLSIDLLLTATWRNGQLESVLPLPQSALVYSW